MARQLKASIIVNNYNYGRFVGEAIESALAQTFPHTEVIVVDDGSTDDSRDVIAGYEDHLITVLKPNGGQASAFNLAFPMSRGNVIYFLDSDDVLEPDAVQRSICYFEDSSIVKVHWQIRHIDERGEPTGVIRPKILPSGNLRDQAIRVGPASHFSPPTSGNAWSRALLEPVFPVNEEHFRNEVDSYSMAMAPLLGEFGAISSPLTRYRMHAASISKGLGAERRLRQWEVRAIYMRDYLAKQGFEVSIDDWRRANGYYQKLKDVIVAGREIDGQTPAGAPVILVASNLFVPSEFAPERTVHQIPSDHWESDNDDRLAITFVKVHADQGVRYLALAGGRFRKRGQLRRFEGVMREHYKPLLENDRILIFDLEEDLIRE